MPFGFSIFLFKIVTLGLLLPSAVLGFLKTPPLAKISFSCSVIL
jgi:hypothetical protein